MNRTRIGFAVTTIALVVASVVIGLSCSSGGPSWTSEASSSTEKASGSSASAAGSVAATGRASDAELARSGGDATVTNSGANAFGQPVSGLSKDGLRAFVVGNNFFNDNWVTAPASTAGRDGLGPLFNAQACSSCHFKDGRGSPPTAENPTAKGLLVRLSVPGSDSNTGGPLAEPSYGPQFQDHGITGVTAEGALDITYEDITGSYGDGSTFTLAKPIYRFTNLGYGAMHPEVLTSPRVGNGVFGSGLLEAIPESTIRAFADPDDSDGDGISGRVNQVWSSEFSRTVLGRFGWKANVASVREQVAGAFGGDIGMTSSLVPDQPCTAVQLECLAAPSGGDPELDDKKLERVTFYTRTLAVPARREIGDKATRQGERTFAALGCTACHKTTIKTGKASPKQLSNQTIHPYTDMLLHDMGPGLADDRPDFLASGSEWRTAPLWGIGLTKTVNGHTRFLHDGRARNLTEAVLWHGGEAQRARDGFVALDPAGRSDLIRFLESL